MAEPDAVACVPESEDEGDGNADEHEASIHWEALAESLDSYRLRKSSGSDNLR